MNWKMKPSDAEAVTRLAASENIPVAIARLLIQRGITTPEAVKIFLNPGLEQLHSPFEMLGMQAAVVRVQHAIAEKEPILIYGDYDVDGTTAVVILKTCIELCGGSVHFHVPHRLREGYGMRDDV